MMTKYMDSTNLLIEKFRTELTNLSSVIARDRKTMSTIQSQYRELQKRLKKKDLLIERYRAVLRKLASVGKVIDEELQKKVNISYGLGDNRVQKKVDVVCGPDEAADEIGINVDKIETSCLPEKVSVTCGEDRVIDKIDTCLREQVSVACEPDKVRKSRGRKRLYSKNEQKALKTEAKTIESAPKKNSVTIIKRDSMQIYDGCHDESEARETRRVQRRIHAKQVREKTRQSRRNTDVTVVDKNVGEPLRDRIRFKRSHNNVKRYIGRAEDVATSLEFKF